MWTTKYSHWAPLWIHCKYSSVAELFGLGPQHVVLDWGAGCGQHLDYLAEKLRFRAAAVDLVDGNVDWGRRTLRHLTAFCRAGSELPFPPNTFHAVLSHATLYHIKDEWAQCRAVLDVLAVLRPGGCAWFGWHGHNGNAEFPVASGFWKRRGGCFWSRPEVVAAAVDEEPIFGFLTNSTKRSSEKPYSLIACKTDRNASVNPDRL